MRFRPGFANECQQLIEYIPGPDQWFWDKNTSLNAIFNTPYHYLIAKDPCASLLLSPCCIYGPWEVPISFLRRFEFCENSSSEGYDNYVQLKHYVRDEVKLNMSVDQLYRVFLVKRKQNLDSSLNAISWHGFICHWRFSVMGNSRIEWIMQASYGLARYLRSCYEE
jgi:hypothetical protein